MEQCFQIQLVADSRRHRAQQSEAERDGCHRRRAEAEPYNSWDSPPRK